MKEGKLNMIPSKSLIKKFSDAMAKRHIHIDATLSNQVDEDNDDE